MASVRDASDRDERTKREMNREREKDLSIKRRSIQFSETYSFFCLPSFDKWPANVPDCRLCPIAVCANCVCAAPI